MASSSDDLFNVRNNFYVGAYPSAIKDALSTVTDTPEATQEKDCLVHRCYIAMGNYKMVIDNVSEKDSADAQAVKLLAVYLNTAGSKEGVMESLKKLLDSKPAKANTLAIVAATIYMHEEKYEEALRLLHPRATLEYMSLNVQACLAIFRTDLAQKEVAAMSAINDDATLTQLATARLNMALGGAGKWQEAYFIYQDMVEKYGGTVMLYNGLATCQMLQNNYGEAQVLLKQALEKNPNDPVTLANLICCDQHLTKGGDFGVYMKQLKASGGSSSSSILHHIQSLEASFDSISVRYSANT